MNLFEHTKDQIMKLVSEAEGKRLRPHYVEKTISESMGISIFAVKEALNDLVQSEELVFTYRDPCSYVEIPAVESHHAARPMKVVVDAKGESWICDSAVDPSKDLTSQDCWRCGEMAFTRND